MIMGEFGPSCKGGVLLAGSAVCAGGGARQQGRRACRAGGAGAVEPEGPPAPPGLLQHAGQRDKRRVVAAHARAHCGRHAHRHHRHLRHTTGPGKQSVRPQIQAGSCLLRFEEHQSAHYGRMSYSAEQMCSLHFAAQANTSLVLLLKDMRRLLRLSAALGSGAAADAVEARGRRTRGRGVAAAVGGQGARRGGAAGVRRSRWLHCPVDHQAGAWLTHVLITCAKPCAFTAMLLRAPACSCNRYQLRVRPNGRSA